MTTTRFVSDLYATVGQPRRKDTNVPHAPDTTCTAVHVDGCPNCVVNVEPPIALEVVDRGHLATYVCADCGHEWDTAWGCN